MLFVAIQDRDIQTQIQRQGLIPLELAVDLVEAVPQLADIHHSMHPPHGVGADHGPLEPPLPESGGRDRFQRIEASQTRPEHRQGGLQDERGWSPRMLSLVGNFVEHLAGKVKHLLGIANDTVKQGMPGVPLKVTTPA